ncbi:MAG: class I SAM-dependent methyltransferase [Oscillospiraceae bacterium]|nr:class I SAM-dependent methyltransferase [Oscillospiraceae bacterium]
MKYNQNLENGRYVPWMPISTGMHYDHLGRYYFVKQFLKSGKVILDCASGEGYGSAILAQDATNKVVGVDIDDEIVQFANSKYKRDNLQFLQGTVCQVPVEGKEVFDIICSFETLEHVDEQEQILMIDEFSRLLKHGGLLFISTPNLEYTSKLYNIEDNPYHKRECTFDEFDKLLATHFPFRTFFGQQNYFQNQIFSVQGEGERDTHRTIETFLTPFEEALIKVDITHRIPKNYLCVASKSNFNLDIANAFTTDVSNSYIKELTAQFTDQINKTNEQILTLNDHIQNMLQSKSWKLTKPLRAVRNIFRAK